MINHPAYDAKITHWFIHLTKTTNALEHKIKNCEHIKHYFPTNAHSRVTTCTKSHVVMLSEFTLKKWSVKNILEGWYSTPSLCSYPYLLPVCSFPKKKENFLSNLKFRSRFQSINALVAHMWCFVSFVLFRFAKFLFPTEIVCIQKIMHAEYFSIKISLYEKQNLVSPSKVCNLITMYNVWMDYFNCFTDVMNISPKILSIEIFNSI